MQQSFWSSTRPSLAIDTSVLCVRQLTVNTEHSTYEIRAHLHNLASKIDPCLCSLSTLSSRPIKRKSLIPQCVDMHMHQSMPRPRYTQWTNVTLTQTCIFTGPCSALLARAHTLRPASYFARADKRSPFSWAQPTSSARCNAECSPRRWRGGDNGCGNWGSGHGCGCGGRVEGIKG